MRLFALVVFAGCFSKPPPPDGDGVDAPVAPPCSAPAIADDFDDLFVPVCGAGFEDGNVDSMIERGGGVLRERPAANIANDASCTWPSFDFELGAFVQIRQTLREGGTYTLMHVKVNDEQVGLSVLHEIEPVIEMFDTGADTAIVTLPYDASEMQWFRLRPAGGRIAGDVSSDGKTWRELGVTTATPAPTGDVEISLIAGAYNPIADPGVAELDNFNVCP